MTKAALLDSARINVCNVFLGLGAGLFALGLYMGFVWHANPALVFGLLGVTTVVFVMVLLVLLKPAAFGFMGSNKVVQQPEVPVNPERESTAVVQPHAAEIQPKVPPISLN